MENDKKLYGIKEICEMYSLSRKLIDRAIRNGQLKAIQIDEKQKKLKLYDVDRWLDTLIYSPYKYKKSA